MTGMALAGEMSRHLTELGAIHGGLAWAAPTREMLYRFIQRTLLVLHLQMQGDDE